MKTQKWSIKRFINFLFKKRCKITIPNADDSMCVFKHTEAYVVDYEGDEGEICQITMGYWDYLSISNRAASKIKKIKTLPNFWG